MATHAAIRGAGRVCECVRMYRECGFTGGVFNRGAETDGTHSLRHDGLTHLKSSSSNLSLPLDQIFSVLSLFFFFFSFAVCYHRITDTMPQCFQSTHRPPRL